MVLALALLLTFSEDLGRGVETFLFCVAMETALEVSKDVTQLCNFQTS